MERTQRWAVRTVQALARGTAEDRPLDPLTHGQIDHPSSTGNKGDHRGLGALAHDPKGPATTLQAQVLDVRTAGIADPQAVQPQQDSEGPMDMVEVLGGEEEAPELRAIEAPTFWAVDGRAAHVLGGLEPIRPSMWAKR